MKQSDISRKLVKLLRHEAPNLGVNLDRHGGVKLSYILSLSKLGLSLELIHDIVTKCPKQRFKIYKDMYGEERICASQGHSFPVVPFGCIEITLENIDELDINPMTIVHGTYNEFIEIRVIV